MSRHRKQRLKRFRRLLATVDWPTINLCLYRLDNTGKLPAWATPLDKLAALRYR